MKDAISNFELDTDRPVAWAYKHPEVQPVAEYNETQTGEELSMQIKTPDIGVDKAVVAEILV